MNDNNTVNDHCMFAVKKRFLNWIRNQSHYSNALHRFAFSLRLVASLVYCLFHLICQRLSIFNSIDCSTQIHWLDTIWKEYRKKNHALLFLISKIHQTEKFSFISIERKKTIVSKISLFNWFGVRDKCNITIHRFRVRGALYWFRSCNNKLFIFFLVHLIINSCSGFYNVQIEFFNSIEIVNVIEKNYNFADLKCFVKEKIVINLVDNNLFDTKFQNDEHSWKYLNNLNFFEKKSVKDKSKNWKFVWKE